MSVATKKKKIFDGRYEVLSIVGRGACSVVYHAKNITSPSSEVALKVLINQQGGTSSTDRLRKEALAMVSSRHRYVIRLDDFHSVQDLCYLSMEYAKEGDLRKYSAKLGGKLPIEQALMFFKQTSEALSFVHRVGITHRDIKPDNVLVLNEREIRLTDFGVAVLPGEQASLDDLQQGVGTMSYMAPEVLEGKNCDKISDIYSLGVSFYEMVSGIHPFESAPLIKQLEVREDNKFPHILKLVPNLPKNFAEVIMRCMRYQPDQRFLSMSDLLKALNDGAGQEKKASTPPQKKSQAGNKRIKSSPKIKLKPQQTPAPKAKPEVKAAPTPPPPPPQKDLDKELEDEIDEILSELEDSEQTAEPENKVAPEPEILKDTEDADDIELDYDDDLLEEEETGSSYLDPRASKRSETPKPSVYKPSYSTDANPEVQKPSFLSTLLISALVLYTANFVLFKLTGYKIFGDSGQEYAEQDENAPTIIAKVSEPIKSFPALPAGMYEGTIYDIILGQESKLVVISLPEQNSLIFIVGAEGWSPSLSALPQQRAGAKNNTIRVSSNGTVLDLEGEIVDGSVQGVYTNALNGTRAKWNIKPFGK